MASFVRAAEGADLDALAAIESAADEVFRPLFGELGWGVPPSGQERAAEEGFLLVVSDSEEGAPLGFIHVREREDIAHLEQLSVLPEQGRKGHGTALLKAALDEASARGHRSITLRTFDNVPWNAPYYRRHGFTDIMPPDDPFYAELLETEERLRLSNHGPRVLLRASLGMEMDADTFEKLVIDELDQLPDEMVENLDNVVFVVEEEAEDGQELFGLYDGLAITERGGYGLGELPDRIVIYRKTHLAACRNEKALRDEVHTTLVHEIAHFYGIDDEQLHELGWA